MNTRILLTSLAFFLSASAAFAEDWPHWRGPQREGGLTGNGVAASGANPPVNWSAAQNVRWKTAIPGAGSGSPVVWGDVVFVTTAVPTGRSSGRLPELDFVIFAIDRSSGDVLWKQVAVRATPHQPTHSTNGFASASPCTDGEMVYAPFGSRGLYAYTMAGELVWKRDDFGKMITRNDFGEGSSPTLSGDKLLVPWDHEGPSSLYCLNKKTGETIWQASRDEPTNWATPLVIKHDGKTQVVMNGQNMARAYDLDSGTELWRCGGQTQRPVATPVATEDLVAVGSGFRGSYLGAFDPSGSGDIEGTPFVAWTIQRDTPDIASLLLSENRLYFHKAKTGVISCVDIKTGKPYFLTQRVPAIRTTYASPVAAGGYVFLTGRGGNTIVIKDSENFEVVAENDLGEGVDATPAFAGDQVFIRSAKHLFCIAK